MRGDTKMPREKKDARPLSIKLSTPVFENLEQFCEESGMTKTLAIEKILSNFFAEYFNRPEKERKIFK